jgi:hypothetical protein
VHAVVVAVVNVSEFRGGVDGVVHARTLLPLTCEYLLYNSSSVGRERLLYSVAQYARYELTAQRLLNRRFSRYRRPDAGIPPDMRLCNVGCGWPLCIVIGDTPVAKGTLVVVPIWHLHHDGRSFPDPESFCPERFLPGGAPIPRSAFIPFGAGPHFCLGQHFATIELTLIAAEIIQQYDLLLEEGFTLPEPVVDLALKPRTPLRVRFTRR